MADAFEGWAIVELMGHRRLAGFVTEQEIAGSAFLRLDISGPVTDDPVARRDGFAAAVTQFYSPGAVYCITPTTEEIARQIGARSRPAPVQRFELDPAPGATASQWSDDFAADDGKPSAAHADGCQDAWCGGECLEGETA